MDEKSTKNTLYISDVCNMRDSNARFWREGLEFGISKCSVCDGLQIAKEDIICQTGYRLSSLG